MPVFAKGSLRGTLTHTCFFLEVLEFELTGGTDELFRKQMARYRIFVSLGVGHGQYLCVFVPETLYSVLTRLETAEVGGIPLVEAESEAARWPTLVVAEWPLIKLALAEEVGGASDAVELWRILWTREWPVGEVQKAWVVAATKLT